jgi:L-asparaginase
MSAPFSIQLFVCGGTLDKEYDAVHGDLRFFKTSLPQILDEAQCTVPVALDVLFLKDSLLMDDDDREAINVACSQSTHQHIVITHGTDTMTQTASLLQSNPDLEGKTIVLTGAMRPYRLGRSDANFNLGAALMAAQLASPGVYVCMNGRLFTAGKVHKNRAAGQFESR